jgi:hypothetical protein
MASFRRNSLRNSALSFLVGVWAYSFSRSHTFATLLLSPFVLAQQAPVDSGSEDGLVAGRFFRGQSQKGSCRYQIPVLCDQALRPPTDFPYVIAGDPHRYGVVRYETGPHRGNDNSNSPSPALPTARERREAGSGRRAGRGKVTRPSSQSHAASNRFARQLHFFTH